LNSRYQAHLEPLNGTNSYAKMNDKFLVSSPFFTLTLYTHSVHLKDTLEVSGTHSDNFLQHICKVL